MKTKHPKDIEFMTDTSGAVLEDPNMPAHYILWITFLFFAVAFYWANVAMLDEVTRGDGKVIPSSEIQVIQNLEGGIVEEINVQEGDAVDKDQVLMIIDDTQFSSDLRESQIRTLALQIKISRLSASASGKNFVISRKLYRAVPYMIEDELALFNTEKQELELKVAILEDSIKEKEQALQETKRRIEQLRESHRLVTRERELTYPLVAEGAASQVELLRLERTINDLKGELETSELSIPKLETEIESEKKKIDETKLKFQIRARAELTDVKSELKALYEANLALADKVKRTLVRSPVKGVVNQITVNTIGGIIQPGEELMEIVPTDDTLLIEADIRPQDIGFLHPGLPATVKLTAYDFAVYGGLKARVEHISPDTTLNDKKENVYQIRVRTEKNYLEKDEKRYPIISGMRASVDILTGKKSVLDYILKPILKTKQKALTER